jgi:hypothetical protein
MAELLIDEIRELAFDEKIDITVWKVKKDKDHPHGLKYSFNYRIWNGIEWIEVIRYDNAHGGGDHIHLFGKIKPIKFRYIGSINDEIYKLINKHRGEIDEIKTSRNTGNE